MLQNVLLPEEITFFCEKTQKVRRDLLFSVCFLES
jgi:hypothetical protein